MLFCVLILQTKRLNRTTPEPTVPDSSLVFGGLSDIKPSGLQIVPIHFVNTSAICRGNRSRRPLACASPRENLMIRTVKTVSLCVFVLVISCVCFGQGGVATGDLHVTVKDPAGNLVTNATVTAKDLAKGLVRTATGDGEGGYSVRLLPTGTYSVTIDAAGFNGILNTGVAITVGGLVELPITLSVKTGNEVIEGSSQAELVETSGSSTTVKIRPGRIYD